MLRLHSIGAFMRKTAMSNSQCVWSEKGPECPSAPPSMVVHSLKTHWDQLARIQEGWKQEGQAATHSSAPLHSLAPRALAQGLLLGTNTIHKSHEEPPDVQWALCPTAPPTHKL